MSLDYDAATRVCEQSRTSAKCVCVCVCVTKAQAEAAAAEQAAKTARRKAAAAKGRAKRMRKVRHTLFLTPSHMYHWRLLAHACKGALLSRNPHAMHLLLYGKQ